MNGSHLEILLPNQRQRYLMICLLSLICITLRVLILPLLSDNVGRKKLIYPGMIIQAIGIWIILFSESSYAGLISGMSLLGIGTALVYPTLLAAISDIAHPQWRATSLGVYRFWRDLGFVFGAVGIGFIADIYDLSIAIQSASWIALASGIFVFIFMRETKKGY